MTMATRLVPATYRGVLGNQPFRRLLSAGIVSSLGDGMSVVAVSWLAIQIAAPEHVGLVVGAAVAAYTLPAAAGVLAGLVDPGVILAAARSCWACSRSQRS